MAAGETLCQDFVREDELLKKTRSPNRLIGSSPTDAYRHADAG
jgi:hypothetical protein